MRLPTCVLSGFYSDFCPVFAAWIAKGGGTEFGTATLIALQNPARSCSRHQFPNIVTLLFTDPNKHHVGKLTCDLSRSYQGESSSVKNITGDLLVTCEGDGAPQFEFRVSSVHACFGSPSLTRKPTLMLKVVGTTLLATYTDSSQVSTSRSLSSNQPCVLIYSSLKNEQGTGKYSYFAHLDLRLSFGSIDHGKPGVSSYAS